MSERPTLASLTATIETYDDPDDKLTIALGNFNRVEAEVAKLREALQMTEGYLSLARYRSSVIAWGQLGMPSLREVDAAITKARTVMTEVASSSSQERTNK